MSDLKDIHHWMEYKPGWEHYLECDPNIVAAGVKIEDVYRTISLARAHMFFQDVGDFGQLISEKDDLYLNFIKSTFLQDSMMYYNICIDLSWQVLWYYFGSNDINIIKDKVKYNSEARGCNLESLNYRLQLAKQEKLRNIINDFFNSDSVKEIRDLYNYMKHRGTFYVELMGKNEEFIPFNINGINPPMITRKELDLDDWTQKLTDFDREFVNYFELIISIVIPKSYKDCTFSFTSFDKYFFKYIGL